MSEDDRKIIEDGLYVFERMPSRQMRCDDRSVVLSEFVGRVISLLGENDRLRAESAMHRTHPVNWQKVGTLDMPRRVQMEHWIPAEKAIYDAVQAVESAGCHPLLTEAVVLLGRARDRVADFVELPNAESRVFTPPQEHRDMSWSVSMIGKPENVAAELDRQSATMDGQSKVEFDDALPHLKALATQNFYEGDQQPIIKLTASGSGYAKDGKQIQRSLTTTIESSYVKLV